MQSVKYDHREYFFDWISLIFTKQPLVEDITNLMDFSQYWSGENDIKASIFQYRVITICL